MTARPAISSCAKLVRPSVFATLLLAARAPTPAAPTPPPAPTVAAKPTTAPAAPASVAEKDFYRIQLDLAERIAAQPVRSLRLLKMLLRTGLGADAHTVKKLGGLAGSYGN